MKAEYRGTPEGSTRVEHYIIRRKTREEIEEAIAKYHARTKLSDWTFDELGGLPDTWGSTPYAAPEREDYTSHGVAAVVKGIKLLTPKNMENLGTI